MFSSKYLANLINNMICDVRVIRVKYVVSYQAFPSSLLSSLSTYPSIPRCKVYVQAKNLSDASVFNGDLYCSFMSAIPLLETMS